MSSQSQSNVGFRGLYQSADQRSHAHGEIDELTRQTGKNVRGFMPKDQQDKMNKLHMQEVEKQIEENMKDDPTFHAKFTGRRPSRGALIDKELQEEEEEYLRRKSQSNDGVVGKKQ